MQERVPGTSISLGLNFTQLLPRESLGQHGLEYKSMWGCRRLGGGALLPAFPCCFTAISGD